jgi:hypothetical protein
MVTETHPNVYAMDPHTTKVPAEKKLINSDSPLIHHGTAPPAAKKLFMFLPEPEKERPAIRIPTEKTIITM